MSVFQYHTVWITVLFYFIEVLLTYDLLLVSNIQQSDSEREIRSPAKENSSGYHQTSQRKPYRPEVSGMVCIMQ